MIFFGVIQQIHKNHLHSCYTHQCSSRNANY